MDFWCVAITMLGISSIAGAVNILATIVLLRAPGMSFNRMPLFVWANFVNQFLILGALPSLTAAAILLYLDRHFGTAFFNPDRGGDRPPVAAPVLVLRPPRGVHPDPAGLRGDLRDHPRLLPKADLRLRLHRLLFRGHRLPELHRVGAPHVRGGHELAADAVFAFTSYLSPSPPR